MARQDVAERVATELVEWLERVSDQAAEALLDSALAPRVVEPSRAARLAYFRGLLFSPDGAPNPAGRQRVIDEYGPDVYETVALELSRPAPEEVP